MAQGRIVYGGPRARRWLQGYFPRSKVEPRAGRAVGRLLRMAETQGRGRSFVVTNNRAELAVVPLYHTDDGLLCATLTERHREKQPRRGAPDELSRREAQVLDLIRAGGTDKQIAIQLGVCRSTVSKHMQRIFAKLRVNNRTAAVLRHVAMQSAEAERGGSATA
jgi:DNA-binding CsgD family transcriptional regulator